MSHSLLGLFTEYFCKKSASIFSHIALYLQDISLLGLLSTSFLIGIGLFQIPGGILAAIPGPRKTAIYGIIIADNSESISYHACNLSVLRNGHVIPSLILALCQS
jgi:MFS family permease